MFPTSAFRMAWDLLRATHTEKVADKMYVQILEIAARESQDAVADALRHLLATEHTLDVERRPSACGRCNSHSRADRDSSGST
jgi:hypothetical protein